MSAAEVEAAVAQLEELAKGGHKPSHYVARRLLLALGQALREERGGSSAWVARAQAASEAAGPTWRTEVQGELSLACGEFAQCVDPRYLALPTYDLEYTRAARLRLGDRLRAALELGFTLSERETDVLDLADRVLATFEQNRAEPRPHPKPQPGPSETGPGDNGETSQK
ncbi:MAG: hypothetical protein EXS08_06115, partial [Planctomycetes bacterium]|nr:hypothetical protein [Planctomycetota bacterium]